MQTNCWMRMMNAGVIGNLLNAYWSFLVDVYREACAVIRFSVGPWGSAVSFLSVVVPHLQLCVQSSESILSDACAPPTPKQRTQRQGKERTTQHESATATGRIGPAAHQGLSHIGNNLVQGHWPGDSMCSYIMDTTKLHNQGSHTLGDVTCTLCSGVD